MKVSPPLMTIASFLFVPIFEYIETINESFKIFNRYTNETEIVGLTSPYFLLHAVAAISSFVIWKSLNHAQQRAHFSLQWVHLLSIISIS